jgi:hypothetical protein
MNGRAAWDLTEVELESALIDFALEYTGLEE